MALITNRDQDFPVCTTADNDENSRTRILPIAMDHGVQERLAERDFDINFAAVLYSEPRNKAHGLINERRYRTEFTGEEDP